MPAFRSITLAADLPAVGSATERLVFDLKAKPKLDDSVELAKDVAAFANASGGVILIGAAERKPEGVLAAYPAVDAKLAGSTKDAYERAIRDRCRPRPIVDVVIVPVGKKRVVCVTVWPFPGQLVGVHIEKDAYRFPVRTTTHTIYLQPEQMGMFFEAGVRRLAIVLESIPPGSYVELSTPKSLENIRHGEVPPEFGAVKMRRVDALRNCLELEIRRHRPRGSAVHFGPHERVDVPAKKIQTDGVVAIPIDGVASAWQVDDQRWRIHVTGEIAKVAGANPDFIFIPAK